MTSVLSLEEIATCRSGPDNAIDLKAVYGGRISGRKQTSLKVNPVFTDHQAAFTSEDDQNISLHVKMYETFPRTKDRQTSHPVTQGEKMVHNGHLTNGHLKVANGGNGLGDYSGKGEFIEEDNQLMDFNRNTLSQSKTFDSYLTISQKADQDIAVYAKVTKKRNVPELLGPVNNEKIHVDVVAEIDDKEGKSQNDNYNEQNKTTFIEKQKYQKSGSSLSKNEDSYDDGLKNIQCYENTGFVNDEGKNYSDESNLAANTSVLTRTDSLNLLSQSKNAVLANSQFSFSPLIHHDNQITSEDESEGKEVLATEILTEVIVHNVDEASMNCSDLKRNSCKLCRQENLCDSLDEIEDEWPEIDTLVRSDDDVIVEVKNQSHEVSYPRLRSISDVFDPDYATIESVNEIDENEDLRAKEGTCMYIKNTKSSKESSKGSNINEGSTRTLKSILTNISHSPESQTGNIDIRVRVRNP